VVLDYAGVRAADFSPRAAQATAELADLYVGNMDEGHARVKMDRGQATARPHLVRLDRRRGLIGVYYYRIYSPVILIEFDHQRPANLARFAEGAEPADSPAHFTAWYGPPTATITERRTSFASTTYRTRTRSS